MTIETGTYVTVTHKHYRQEVDRTTTGTVIHVYEPSKDGSYSVQVDDALMVIGTWTDDRTGKWVATNSIEPTTRPVVYDYDEYED